MRVTLIHNPGAGTGGPSKDELLSAVRDAGHEAVCRSADEDDALKALEALEGPDELVVVAGGDGTVGRVAKRLAGRGVPVAVVPVGTANNIAAALGAGAGDVADLRARAAGWAMAPRTPFDVGRAAGPWGERLFLESFGGGLFAALIAALDAEKRRGKAPEFSAPEPAMEYAVGELRQVLRTTEPRNWTVKLDGADRSGQYLLVEAMNIRRVGPSLVLAPAADFGDGLLDVVLVDEAGRGRLDEYLRARLTNPALLPDLPVIRAQRVTLAPQAGVPIHIDDKLLADSDGNWGPSGAIQLHVDRAALSFVVP